MATLFLCFFCRTNDKKCRKNVFVENIDVRERRTNIKTLKVYLLIQRIFVKFSQKVILFCRKCLTIWYVPAIIILSLIHIYHFHPQICTAQPKCEHFEK